MVRLVFIPSFGTNSTLYDALRSTETLDLPATYTEWLPVGSSKSLKDYARRFIDHYKISETDIIVGVSLGGVLAIEIQKLIEVSKLIIISSLKSGREKPLLFKTLQKTSAYKLFSPTLTKWSLDVIAPFYGKRINSYLWFRQVFKASDNEFLKWAFKQIVCWENQEIPENLIHIHGTRDPLFSISNAKQVDYVISGGTHAMIRFNAKEIAEIIKLEVA